MKNVKPAPNPFYLLNKYYDLGPNPKSLISLNPLFTCD